MKIEKIKSDTLVKIIFKPHDERTPIIGKFVDLNDSKYLKGKNMVRFVNQSRLDNYKGDVAMTRIYAVNDFSQVIPV